MVVEKNLQNFTWKVFNGDCINCTGYRCWRQCRKFLFFYFWFFLWKWISFFLCMQLKAMDANRYATKKTIAQGMLDIALLTANASQLKYILQVGERHEFYTLMLILISISIIMQVCVSLFFSGSILSFSDWLFRDVGKFLWRRYLLWAYVTVRYQVKEYGFDSWFRSHDFYLKFQSTISESNLLWSNDCSADT